MGTKNARRRKVMFKQPSLASLSFFFSLLACGVTAAQEHPSDPSPAPSAVPSTTPTSASKTESTDNTEVASPPAGEPETGKEPDAAEEDEDDFKWFEFYIEALAGYEYFDLTALKADPAFLGASQSGTPPTDADAQAAAASASQSSFTGHGFAVNGGLGFRFVSFLGLGVNYQYSGLDLSGEKQTLAGTTSSSGPIDLHTLILQLQLILPLGPVDIMLLGGFGYARLISGIDISDAFNSDGYAGKVGLALDVYVVKWLSLGAGCTVGMLYFSHNDAQAGSLAIDALGRIVFHIN